MVKREITDWAGIRNTDPKAVPIDHKAPAKGRRIIHVSNAQIRDAVVTGYFQVADVAEPHSEYAGKQRIQVECLWYGKKPKTCWMNLTVDGGYKDVANYAGEVISNMGCLK